MLPSAAAMFTLDVPFAIPDRLKPAMFAAGIFDSPKPSPLKMPDVESMFPTATTFAPVVMFPPATLPVASCSVLPPVSTRQLEPRYVTLPVTAREVNVPKDVPFG